MYTECQHVITEHELVDELVAHLRKKCEAYCGYCFEEMEIRTDSLGIEATNLYEDYLRTMDCEA